MKPPLILSSCDSFFSIQEYYLANPNDESVRNWISNNISKFHVNPTVNETGIIILLKPFWVYARKEKATMRKIFLSDRTWYIDSQRWTSPRSSFFWDKLGGLRKKERILGEERRNEIVRLRRLRSQSENWPSMLLFKVRGIYDLLFTLFIYLFIYYFIKTNFILFSIKQINKIPFLFSLKSLS